MCRISSPNALEESVALVSVYSCLEVCCRTAGGDDVDPCLRSSDGVVLSGVVFSLNLEPATSCHPGRGQRSNSAAPSHRLHLKLQSIRRPKANRYIRAVPLTSDIPRPVLHSPKPPVQDFRPPH